MAKYHTQETDYSCGASAFRNILKFFGKNISEKRVRQVLGTTKEGTLAKEIIDGAKYYGYEYGIIETKSEKVFQNKIKKILNDGYCCILEVDKCTHWIAVLRYENKKFVIVDTEFKSLGGKSATQKLTLRQLTHMGYNYDKIKDKRFFLFIKLKPLSE